MKLFCLLFLLGGLWLPVPANASDYPSKPVTIVVPYAPGGATDIVARVMGEQLSKKLGQNFLVVNKPGAVGIVAMQELVRAKPDGYTILLSNVTVNAITPLLFAKKMSFDYATTIQPITQVATLPGVFVATTVNFAPRTLPEVLEFAKQNPGKIRYGTTGTGSYPQFDTELLIRKAGVTMTHVPMKGGASDMINGLAVGDVQVGFLNIASPEGMIKSGRLRALAVVSPTELAQYPGVPTMAQAGFAGIGTEQWQAVFVKTGTPRDIVDLLFKSIREVMQSEQTAQAFRSNGIVVALSASPEAAAEWQRQEQSKWRKMIDDTQISVE